MIQGTKKAKEVPSTQLVSHTTHTSEHNLRPAEISCHTGWLAGWVVCQVADQVGWYWAAGLLAGGLGGGNAAYSLPACPVY